MLKPIIKFNSGIGAILCHSCSKIIKQNLTQQEVDGNTDLLFCDDKCKQKYPTEEPSWVCIPCAYQRGASIPDGHVYTVHVDVCGICEKLVAVTEPRDFGKTRNLLRIPINNEDE